MDFYQTLNLTKNATQEEIKRAYKKLVLKHHPDKGGNREQFNKIQEAYETLSDPQKRQAYDNPQSHFNANNIFASFFQTNMHNIHVRRPNLKAPTLQTQLSFTLEELYTGLQHTLTVNVYSPCQPCNGNGTADKTVAPTCQRCNGTGTLQQQRMIAPGIFQQNQQTCPQCQGEGKQIPTNNKCPKCNGQKTETVNKNIVLNIPAGLDSGQTIIIKNIGHQIPNQEQGDIHIRIVQKPHTIFNRTGNHLVLNKKITLLEAITGFQFKLTHLDKKEYTLMCNRIINNKEQYVIKGKGMQTGDLYLNFDIEYPTNIGINQLEKQKRYLDIIDENNNNKNKEDYLNI